ncbi:hypothetical protein KP509_19G051100 [Ceratopteris richardii]|uniref:NAD(P)-binding domain-containing protein n=1 Tax=Ceratopteris richardii TaxID=49495 RepID=A0A8T2SNV0_CERRI|nr:hypothetical protein KP509_19G051100 [Ceratopteris richardii]
MAACQMTGICSSSSSGHALQMKAEGISAGKSSCFCGSSSSHLPVDLLLRGQRTTSSRHLITVMAQEARKGTRIFRFGKKQDDVPSEEPAEPTRPGTRLFRFGGPPKVADPEDDEDEEEKPFSGNFGTQIFKSFAKKSGAAVGTVSGALVPVAPKEISFSLPRRQDPKTVFVAGATGQIGARIVQKLLREGYNVRAGVRDLFVAQQLAEFATQYGVVSREEAKRLNVVEFDFKGVESIAKAIGSAAKVVVTIGASEDGPKSKVSFEDASNVVEAAKLANIANLVVVYEPGTGAGDENPLFGLASFFSDIFSKPVAVSIKELLDQIVDSDLCYTLVKTSLTDGMDDASSALQNIVLAKEGGPASLDQSTKIAKGQVASIVAEIVVNSTLAENKVVEAFTSASAADVPLSELLSSIPVDVRREAIAAAKAKAEEEAREKAARERADAEARAAVEEARKATQLAAQLEAEAKQLAAAEAKAASAAEKAQAQAAAAAASVESLASKIKELPGTQKLFAKAKGGDKPLSLPTFSIPSFPAMATNKAKATPTGSSKPQPNKPAPPPKKKQRDPVLATSPPPPPASKPQTNSIFGGLFTQETVYVDEV